MLLNLELFNPNYLTTKLKSMKKTALIVTIICCICINTANAQQNNSSAPKTTLDSLQGEWHLKSNESEGLKIMHDTILYISNNKIVDGGLLYLNRSKFNSVSSTPHNLKNFKDKKNGKYLIVQSGAINNYEVESISTTGVSLYKEGKILDYIKVQ